jgi:hypothetical protein
VTAADHNHIEGIGVFHQLSQGLTRAGYCRRRTGGCKGGRGNHKGLQRLDQVFLFS